MRGAVVPTELVGSRKPRTFFSYEPSCFNERVQVAESIGFRGRAICAAVGVLDYRDVRRAVRRRLGRLCLLSRLACVRPSEESHGGVEAMMESADIDNSPVQPRSWDGPTEGEALPPIRKTFPTYAELEAICVYQSTKAGGGDFAHMSADELA